MATTKVEKLVHVNYSDTFPVNASMIVADFNEYGVPLSRLVNQYLHGWGVASGLGVTTSSDQRVLKVGPGLAVDRRGQLVTLSTDGAGVIGNVPPLTETRVPVELTPEDALKGKQAVLTLRFNEVRRAIIPLPGQPNNFPAGKSELVPWVRLTAADDFVDSDDLIILALITIDGDGVITNVVGGASGVEPQRKRLALIAGGMTLERPSADAAHEITVGTFQPLPTELGVGINAALTCISGMLGIGQSTAKRTLDLVGSAVLREVESGPELVVLSTVLGGAGAVETKDRSGQRMVAMTTSGSGDQQAGYLGISSAVGAELVALSSSVDGAGRVQVQTRSGQAAVVIHTVGDADDGVIDVYANQRKVITLGANGIQCAGEIHTDSEVSASAVTTVNGVASPWGVWCGPGWGQGAATGNIWCGSVFGQGWTASTGGVSGSGWSIGAGGISTNGSLRTSGQVIATGAMFTEGTLSASGTIFSGGNLQPAGQLIAKGALFTDQTLSAKGTIFTDGNVQAKGTIFANGNVQAVGDIFGRSKHFIIPHPKDPSREIVYGCIEGPEAAAYIRGRATLHNGTAHIQFPEHFALIIQPESATIQLTPRSASSHGLAIAATSADGFVARELHDGVGNYEFDYFVAAVRRGYENYEPVVPKGSAVARNTMFANAATPAALKNTDSIPLNAVREPTPQPTAQLAPSASDVRPVPWRVQ